MTVKRRSSNFAMLLRRLADNVDMLSEAEFAALLRHISTFDRNFGKVRQARTAVEKNLWEHAGAVVGELQRANTREEGDVLLRNLGLTRDQLVAVANVRNIYVAKEDTIARIKEKLVESIVGSRLNSLAIRGTSKVQR